MFLPISVNNLRPRKKDSDEIGKTVGGRKVFAEARANLKAKGYRGRLIYWFGWPADRQTFGGRECVWVCANLFVCPKWHSKGLTRTSKSARKCAL